MSDTPPDTSSPTTDEKEPVASPGRPWVWPVIVIAALSAHVTLWLGFVFFATRDPSIAVEPDYYRKAMAWDRLAEVQRTSDSLGWTVEVETARQTGLRGERRLACRLRGPSGAPLSGALVQVELFHHARSRDRVELDLTEETDGVYAARPRMRRAGIWECRVRARRGADLFVGSVLHEIPREESGR